jgi:hypothetical protein
MKLADALVLVNAELPAPATYNRLLGLVHQGVVPAYRNLAGTRWEVDPADIPAIREAMLATRQARMAPAQSEGSA